jgi:hypothetical protein
MAEEARRVLGSHTERGTEVPLDARALAMVGSARVWRLAGTSVDSVSSSAHSALSCFQETSWYIVVTHARREQMLS